MPITIGPSVIHAGHTELAHRCRLDGELPPQALRDLKAQLSYWDDALGIYVCAGDINRYCRCGKRIEGGATTCVKCGAALHDERCTTLALTFPRGLLDRVVHVLAQGHGLQVQVQYHKPAQTEGDISRFPPLRPYQQEAVLTLDNHAWGILEAPPRSGKTLTLARDWVRRGCPPCVWLCDTIVLAEQAQRVFQGLCPTKTIGLVGDGRCDIGDLTVITAQSAHLALKQRGKVGDLSKRQWYDSQEQEPTRYHEIVDALTEAQHLIRDEAHHATQPIDSGILRNVPNARVRRFASGTPWDTASQGLKLEGLGGPIVHKTEYEYLFTHGDDHTGEYLPYLIRPEVTVYALTSKRYSRSTLWPTLYRDYVVDGQERNRRIVDWTRAHVAEGRSVCVIVRQTTHGEVLQRLLPEARALYGKHGRQQRTEVLTGLAEKRIMVVLSTIMGEGVDISNLDCVVNAAGEQSAIPVMQRLRCMTPAPGKHRAYMLDFEDHARWLSDHSKKRIELYEKFGFVVNREKEEQ